jgi:hypothetical protein
VLIGINVGGKASLGWRQLNFGEAQGGVGIRKTEGGSKVFFNPSRLHPRPVYIRKAFPIPVSPGADIVPRLMGIGRGTN